jgi:hypothetical protein
MKELIDKSSVVEENEKRIKENVIVWFENQGKQKEILCDKCKKEQPSHSCQDITALGRCYIDSMNTANKNEQMFHEGDWITNGQLTCKVLSVTSKSYELHLYNDDNCHFEIDIQSVNKDYHLWTIKDAKEGDVLSYVTDEDDLWIMIYWSLYEPYEGHVHYHALLVNDNFSDKGTCCICINDLKPATKEQYDLLFSKMKEEGYVWDKVNKKLTKKIGDVERIQYDSLNCQKNIVLKWSEEDNKILVKIITALMGANNVECADFNVMYNWLISIKERMEEQQ